MSENNNYIYIKQPKLLNLGHNQDNNIYYNNININYEQENNRIKQKIHELNKIHRQNKEEEDKEEMERLMKCFYKNPFSYMDYLAKKYFIEKANTLENLKIKDDMTSHFRKLCNQIELRIKNYTENEQKKLLQLQKLIENKTTLGMPIFTGNENNEINNNQRNIGLKSQNNELSSIPNSDPEKELFNRLFNNNENYLGSGGGVITRGDVTNMVINNIDSNYNQEKLYGQALSCLKGDKIIAPKKQFLATKNLSLKDIEKEEIKESKNYLNLANQKQIEEYNQYLKNNIKVRKNKEKPNFEKMVNSANNHISNMTQYNKEKKELLKYLQNKLNKDFEEKAIKLAMSKLTICDKNLNEIKNQVNELSPEQVISSLKEKNNIIEQDYNKTQNMVNDFLKGNTKHKFEVPISDEQIDKLYTKYKTKLKSKNNTKQKSSSYYKRNFSSNPYKYKKY